MFSVRDILMFLAGASAFHTLSHIIINLSGTLPLKFFSWTWDKNLNIWAIGINATLTLMLLWLALRAGTH